MSNNTLINYEALFRVSYGLYIVSSGDKNKGNGYISNTVFQVTAEPVRFACCCSKNNYTAELITNTACFSVSVLHKETSRNIITSFGYQSGKDINKMEGISLQYGKTGVPIVLNDCIAFLECKVTETMDMGTHLLYIGELVQSVIIDERKEPLTYLYYRQVLKGVAPKNAPTYVNESKIADKATIAGSKQYKCNVCGYIYDEKEESTAFEDLPDSWLCPLCGAGQEEFTEI